MALGKQKGPLSALGWMMAPGEECPTRGQEGGSTSTAARIERPGRGRAPGRVGGLRREAKEAAREEVELLR